MSNESAGDGDVALTSLQSISRGASLFIGGKILYDALDFALNAVLTRALGSSLYGVYAYANTIVVIALVFTNLGSDNSLLKYVPQYEDDEPKRRLMVGLATITTFVACFAVAAGLYALAPIVTRHTLDDPLLTDVLRLFAILLVFETFAKLVNAVFRSLELLEYQVFVDQIVKPVVRLAAVGIALAVGLSFYGVMVSLVVAGALVLSVSLYFFVTRLSLRPSLDRSAASRDDVVEYYNLSIPLLAKDAGAILRSRVDVLMVGFFLSSAAVGIYNVSLLLSGLISLPLMAFNQLFPPVASRLYANDDRENLNGVFSIVTRWTMTLSLYVGLVLVVYRTEILALFGEEFTAGASVLVFFVVASIVNNAVGPSGYLLMITEHQYVLLVNQWVFGVVNVVLNYYFILEVGLLGAAVATATVNVLVNIARLVEIWYLEGLFPYTMGYLKPLIAGVGAAVAMYGVSLVVSGTPAIVVGAVVGLGSYAGALSVLGIERRDREFFRASVGLRRVADEN